MVFLAASSVVKAEMMSEPDTGRTEDPADERRC
jgi:hypothetical protein